LTLDPFLRLEDRDGLVLAEDDDSGGNLNARIVFKPGKTGTYRVVATTFAHFKVIEEGPYVLSVRTQASR